MEITISLDLPAIVSAATSTERLQPIVDKAIVEAVKAAIQDATGYNSEFQKQLKQQLKDALPHGLAIDDIAKFQFVLNAAISAAVQGANAQHAQAAMSEMVKHVVPVAPERIKLSELMQAARDGYHKEPREAFYAHLKMSDWGGGWFYLDEDADCKDWYKANDCIAFSKDGTVYSLKLSGIDITPKKLPNAIGHMDGLLLSMYVGFTSLDLDIDADDVESLAAEQED